MEPRDLHNWAENLEAGRETDPGLRLAARLRASSDVRIVAPEELRTSLRQQLLVQYDIEPEIAEKLRVNIPAAPTFALSSREAIRARLLASYEVDPELADRLRVVASAKVEMPALSRIELRRRLLTSYAKPNQLRRGEEVRRFDSRRPRIRLATSIAVLVMLLLVSGSFDAGITWAGRFINRLFVTDKVVPTPVLIPTLAPTRAAEMKKEVARQQTAVASSKKRAGIGYDEVSKFQEKMPFTILTPSYLPAGAVLEYVQDISAGNSPGIQFRYVFKDRKFLQITQQEISTGRTIAVERDLVIQEFQLNGHKAVIYNGGEIPGRPKMLFLEWTDGVVWMEIFTTLDEKELAKIAESMAP